MATQSKKTTPKPPIKPDPANPLAGYVRLRQILDSLELGALRYYLDGTTEAQKKQRLKEMEDELMPIIGKLWGGKRRGLVSCPKGFSDCQGVCLPYRCMPQ